MSRNGHLFVVHGKIESLVHDAVILPVGNELWLADYWEELVGTLHPDPPDGWERGWGRLDGKDVWLVSIGGYRPDAYDEILERLDAALSEIAADWHHRGLAPLGRRTVPLVAMPFVGIGRTGYGEERGRIIRTLVERLQRATEHARIDVALVSPDPAVYAAAQFARRTAMRARNAAAARLGELAREGRLALLLGAGVSVPAGLLTWHELVAELASANGLADKISHDLSATDQAELIERAGRKVSEQKPPFQSQVAGLVATAPRPSLVHGLLAGLDCREVVTTNYDRLYESAVDASGRATRSVMPWESAADKDRWVLKLHGDCERPSSIVLTRRHMVMYDSVNRPSGALLQSLLLTKHLLVVGASMTDDNVIRLAHEVQAYRDLHQPGQHPPFGTVLDVRNDTLRGELWAGQLDWIHLEGDSVGEGARSLELFLDELAMHASSSASWLLDSWFAGLLPTDEDRALADDARELYRRLNAAADPTWGPLVDRLREFGPRLDRW